MEIDKIEDFLTRVVTVRDIILRHMVKLTNAGGIILTTQSVRIAYSSGKGRRKLRWLWDLPIALQCQSRTLSETFDKDSQQSRTNTYKWPPKCPTSTQKRPFKVTGQEKLPDVNTEERKNELQEYVCVPVPDKCNEITGECWKAHPSLWLFPWDQTSWPFYCYGDGANRLVSCVSRRGTGFEGERGFVISVGVPRQVWNSTLSFKPDLMTGFSAIYRSCRLKCIWLAFYVNIRSVSLESMMQALRCTRRYLCTPLTPRMHCFR
jgi:hypothetical protein